MTGVLVRRGKRHVMTEAEIGVEQLQGKGTKDFRPLAEARRDEKGFHLDSQRSMALLTH